MIKKKIIKFIINLISDKITTDNSKIPDQRKNKQSFEGFKKFDD